MTDIETALAEALQAIAKSEHGSPWEWWTPREDAIGTSAEFAAAILDALPEGAREGMEVGLWLAEYGDRRWEVSFSPKSKPALRWVVKDDYGNGGHGPTFLAAANDLIADPEDDR